MHLHLLGRRYGSRLGVRLVAVVAGRHMRWSASACVQGPRIQETEEAIGITIFLGQAGPLCNESSVGRGL